MSDLQQQIDELVSRIDTLRKQCLYRSSNRVTRELLSLAKVERQVVPYLLAQFYLMNDSQSTFEPDTGAEAAIEAIALLESEERARQFQPDFPEDAYFHTVSWMSTCAYDNLAKHVAEREGYNSNGVHDTVNEGMQVCRRTGKLECLTCFREYATDVYRASDDLDMALHHARYVTQHHDPDSNNDRRWVGSRDVVNLLLLSGDLDSAWEAVKQSAALVESYHSPNGSRRELRHVVTEILTLQGRPQDVPAVFEELNLNHVDLKPLDKGESPSDELDDALNSALLATLNRDFDQAVKLLSHWDKWLRDHKCIDHWFDTRLRLIAVTLLQSNRPKAEALAEPLEERAKTARDFLTLRRLRQLLSGAPVAPNAAVAPLTTGPFGTGETAPSAPQSAMLEVATVESDGKDIEPDVPAESEEPDTPLMGLIRKIQVGIQESEGNEQVLRGLLDEIIAIDSATITDAEDASWLLFLGHMLARWVSGIQGTWEWGKGLVEKFPQHPGVLNLVADLGASLRQQYEEPEAADKEVTDEQIESWFRQSLDLDSDRANNFGRAGAYFQSVDKLGDAERCFARGFRLARADSRMALSLAEIYAESERPRDALGVLDICIREGCEDSQLFWQAGLIAMACERWDAVVAYLDKFDVLDPNQPWVHYYRATALLESKRSVEALDALKIEALRNPEAPLTVACLRACAYSQLDDLDQAKHHLRIVLDIHLATVDYLTLAGIARLYSKLYDAVSGLLAEDDTDRVRLEKVLLQTGLAPASYFEAHRTGEPIEGVNFYICTLVQDLNDDWPEFPGCLPGQEDWNGYVARWGVLAASEEDATDTVLGWQRKCYPRLARCEECLPQGEGYNDIPGVVWQAAHQPMEEPLDEEPESDE